MATPLQPPPYKVPMFDQKGSMSVTWINFFRALYDRVGGKLAETNVELAVPSSNLQTQVDDLEEDVESNTVSIDDLNQGPVL